MSSSTVLARFNAAKVRELFPVSRRDRRENEDLFRPFLGGRDLRIDDDFYEALVEMLSGDGIAALRAYDTRMIDSGSRKKSFGARALKFLSNAKDYDEESFIQQLSAGVNIYAEGSIDYSMFDLFWKLTGPVSESSARVEAAASEIDDHSTEHADLGADESPTSWRLLADQISELAGGMAAADQHVAGQIAKLAGELLSACIEESAKLAAVDHAEIEQANSRIALLLPEGSWRLPLGASPATREKIEEAISLAERASELVRTLEADFVRVDGEFNNANARGDDDTLALIVASRRDIRGALAVAQQKKQSCLQAIKDLTQDGDPNISSPLGSEAADIKDDQYGIETGLQGSDEPKLATHDNSSGISRPIEPHTPEAVRNAPVEQPKAPPLDEDERNASEGVQNLAPRNVRPEHQEIHREPTPEGSQGRQLGMSADAIDISSRLLEYLNNGETAFAWRLAALAEQRGLPTGIPSVAIEAMALADGIRRSDDLAANHRWLAAVEAMMGRLGSADLADETAQIAFAALLKPALFDPDYGARQHLAGLPRSGWLQPFLPLVDAIAGLGHDVRLSTEDLAALAGAQNIARRPAAEAAVESWLREAKRKRTLHQPTFAIFHKELEPQGEIGRVFEEVLTNVSSAPSSVADFLERYSGNRGAQEDFVSEAEQRGGRPRRDAIEGKALTWFCQRIDEACTVLEDWRKAVAADAMAGRSASMERLRAIVGSLRKSVIDAKEECSESRLRLGAVVYRALDELQHAFEGRAKQGLSPKRDELLMLPLMRLPAGCQDWTGTTPDTLEKDDLFAVERQASSDRAFIALVNGSSISRDLPTAFVERLNEQGILSAGRILQAIDGAGRPAGVEATRLQDVATHARREARGRVEKLRQSLTTISYLEVDHASEVEQHLGRLSAIAQALSEKPDDGSVRIPAMSGQRSADIPPDFPELTAVLQDIQQRKDWLHQQVRSSQLSALRALSGGPLGASVDALISRLEALDPVTIDDAIAELGAGRDVLLPEAERPDAFEAFFPSALSAFDKAETSEVSRSKLLEAIKLRRAAGPLNFSALTGSEADRSRATIEAWGRAQAAMNRRNWPEVRAALVDILGRIGFTGVNLKDQREIIPARLRSLALRFDVPAAVEWFLPAAYGSESQGAYKILVSDNSISIDDIERAIAAESPEAVWLQFHFGRLSVASRREWAIRLRKRQRKVLVLDESLLAHLVSVSGDLLPVFYSCTLPFSWVQPFTTVPRQIPPEAFFGRDDEIRRIAARSNGGCLVYGGRQLGKSALLNHVQRLYNQPARGELALCLDIKPVGGAGSDANRIWSELAFELRKYSPFAKINSDPQDIVSSLRSWCEAEPGRRILVMFDEADNFLAAEHAADYPNLLRMKSLMEVTGWRFKAVFAGLHNVRRMAGAPNSPLPHLGEPICIGPMNQTPENRRDIRRLAIEPMKAAGLEYAEPTLPSDMLARLNYYPSLVQIFGQQIVAAVGQNPPASKVAPRWRLSRELLFEGEAAERIANEIRERFQWTLNLDLRYELIAKSIALYRLDQPGGDTAVVAKGLSAAEIDSYIYWPENLRRPNRGELTELLNEMVDLGVLSSREGRFGLRNAQVAQMLGDRARLNNDLMALHELDEEPAYDAASFHGLLRPAYPNVRSPLSDRQLSQLTSKGSRGVWLVVGEKERVGPNLKALVHAALRKYLDNDASLSLKGSQWRLLESGSAQSEIRRTFDQAGRDRAFVVITGDASEDAFNLLDGHEGVKAGRIRPVWCSSECPLGLTAGRQILVAECWSEAMLRHWLRDESLAPALDDRETRTWIMRVTGGAPLRLAAVRSTLADIVTWPLQDRIAALSKWSQENPIHPAAWLTKIHRQLLEVVAADGDAIFNAEDLKEQVTGAGFADLAALKLMGYLVYTPDEVGRPLLTPFGRLTAECL